MYIDICYICNIYIYTYIYIYYIYIKYERYNKIWKYEKYIKALSDQQWSE